MNYNCKKIGINKYQLEKLPGMKVEVIIYAKEEMLPQLQKDLSLSQLAEAAMLPGVISPVIGMPDIHEGFGLPIGGVMATKNLISVGAVGMDINCGVRLLTSSLTYDRKKFSPEVLRTLINKIQREIPIGVGNERRESLPKLSFEEIVINGAEAVIKNGYGTKDDLDSTEENGKMVGARFKALTPKAIQRAKKQIGTLGSGNHFIELQKVNEIYDQEIAKKFGLFENQFCLMLHSGSRALGHQTCIDYSEIFWGLEEKYGIKVPRKGLAALPMETKEAKNYFSAMAASVNFAFANRQVMTFFVRQVFEQILKDKNPQLTLLYDVAHNIAKWEEHKIKNEKVKMKNDIEKLKNGKCKILVHRKGATRALPAGHPLLPEKFKETGQPAIIPGSMGTASYVLVGLPKASETFFSVNHGAGRMMSRGEAFRTISKDKFETSMKEIIHNLPYQKIADEAPDAYKNIHEVVDTLVEAGITKKVAKLIPLAVVKGD